MGSITSARVIPVGTVGTVLSVLGAVVVVGVGDVFEPGAVDVVVVGLGVTVVVGATVVVVGATVVVVGLTEVVVGTGLDVEAAAY